MPITRVRLKNWKNFVDVEFSLARRAFIIGPNASGKSNLLDALRFLHDLAEPLGGGLASAVARRGGVEKIRSQYAKGPNQHIGIGITVEEFVIWKYDLVFDSGGPDSNAPQIISERVENFQKGGMSEILLNRPDEDDRRDPRLKLLTQSAIQQVKASANFRSFVWFLEQITYQHIIPQLLRGQYISPEYIRGGDPFGSDFLDRLRKMSTQDLDDRLKRIEDILKSVLPQFDTLRFNTDEKGQAHLEARFNQWRSAGTFQNESQLSDGTLRLIGLLWVLWETLGPILLEEPELSLHPAIVRRLAPLIHQAQKHNEGSQVIVSTHSDDLLSDEGIAPEEVILLKPTPDGTQVIVGADDQQIASLMSAGLTANEAAMPKTQTESMQSIDELLR